MDNTKFTKGKWVHSGINGVHNERGNCVAISEGETVEQRRANALLISKAPEMLEALSRLLELTKEMEKRIIDIEKLSYADPKFLAEIQQLITEATEL